MADKQQTPERVLIEPSEAEYLCAIKFPDADPDTTLVEYVRSDVVEALRAALPAPQIKPLIWVKGTARSPIAIYTLAEADNDDEPFWFVYINSKSAGKLGEHPNEESAKAAVWAHHKATIRAALAGTEGDA